MGLELQPPNLAGLIALANGGQGGNLNLESPGKLGLLAFQEAAANNNNMAQNANQRQQIAQAGQLGLLNNATQNRQIDMQSLMQQAAMKQQQDEMAYKYKALGQQGQMNNAENALKAQQLSQQYSLGKGELDAKKQDNIIDLMKLQVEKLADEKKETLKERGAFAATGLMALNNVKTPAEAQLLSQEIAKEALSKGYISKEDAQHFLSSPISARKNMLQMQTMQYGMAEEYKSMRGADAEKSGATEIRLADGTVVKTSMPTEKNKSDLQNDVAFADQNVKELKGIIDSVPESFFGAAALKQQGTKIREWAESIPGLGKLVGPTEEDKSELEHYSGVQGKINYIAMQTIKDLSGLSYTDKQLEFMNRIIPQMGPGHVPSEFKGRAKNLLRFYEMTKQAKKELLDKGISLESNPEEYKDQLLQKMQQLAENPLSSKLDDVRSKLKGMGWDDARIEAAMRNIK